MTANKARLQVEGMEDRWTPAHFANLGEGVSAVATSAPAAQAVVVLTAQADAATDLRTIDRIDRIIDRIDRTTDRIDG